MNKELNVLILGATGLVGTAMETVCENMNISHISLGRNDIDFSEHHKIRNVLNNYDVNVVMNCVAVPSIDPCEQDPELSINLHCNAVLSLAKHCHEKNIILIQPSSHAVFDGLKDSPYIEQDLVKATNVYAATKLLSEKIATSYCPESYIVRFPTLYGERQNKNKGFVDKLISWLKENKEIRIADDKFDSPTYAIDAAEAIIKMVLDKTPYGLYHIANEGWMSYYDFANKIQNVMKTKSVIHRAKNKDFSSNVYKPPKTALRSTKIKLLRSCDLALEEYLATKVLK